MSKLEAREFLDGLAKRLSGSLPAARELDLAIRETVKRARAGAKPEERHLKLPESAFLNGHVLPCLFAEIQQAGLEEEDARYALLNEYHRSMPWLSEAAPAHRVKHPFTKNLDKDASEIYQQWIGESKRGSALVQPCPDFALRHPFPHKIVFEGKYFPKGSLGYARRQLVTDIYQAFFYRGLPAAAETVNGRAAWDYDYSCLLAFDASPGGTLKQAWQALPEKIRNGFWDGANIYVMILGGDG
ncbi:MAG TPA: hypothetical protein VMR86_17965 [Myxococcota bacterium]|nr:hypothetical protein [Myxococcota bacterium]